MPHDRKVIMITGASGGLGRAVLHAFTKAGAVTVAVDREAGTSASADHLALPADVTSETDVTRLIAEVLGRTGRIDGLVNLVGAFAPGRLAETDAAVWQRMLSLNVTSAFLLSKAVIPHMTATGAGRIIHIASYAAMNPFAGAAAYIVAKSGLVALIKTLAFELAGTGVTVNGILPTTIDTPANRAGMPTADRSKWVSPDAIARLLVFLAMDEPGPVTGALIPIGIP